MFFTGSHVVAALAIVVLGLLGRWIWRRGNARLDATIAGGLAEVDLARWELELLNGTGGAER